MKTTRVLKRTALFMRKAIILVKCDLEDNCDTAMVLLENTIAAVNAIDNALATSDKESPHVYLSREVLETAKACVWWIERYTLLYFNDGRAMADYNLTMDAWERVK